MSLRLHGSSTGGLSHGHKRVEARARVAIEAKLETVHGRVTGYLLNLSCHGAMIQASSPPVRGGDVVIKCGPLDALGVVCWVAHERFGMEFDEPIADDLVVELRRMADEAVKHRAHQRLGRPALVTRALTADEWEAAQEWLESSAIR